MVIRGTPVLTAIVSIFATASAPAGRILMRDFGVCRKLRQPNNTQLKTGMRRRGNSTTGAGYQNSFWPVAHYFDLAALSLLAYFCEGRSIGI